jgi:hypothetical protein
MQELMKVHVGLLMSLGLQVNGDFETLAFWNPAEKEDEVC